MTKDIASVEKVLNSRCSGDSKVDFRKSHWSTFINRRPSESVINHVLDCCNVPRFSDGRLLQWVKNDDLFLGFEKPTDSYRKKLLHIESGMQHEAVYLACAAQGIGTCIANQGINGTQYGKTIVTARHLISEIADPYETGKFSTRPPASKKPFVTGKNLSDPIRDSNIECITQLPKLTTFRKSGPSATRMDLSQLLWAARGRTPHCIKMHRWNLMWGLTIPTWGGGQNFTTVYLAMGGKLYLYVNWTEAFSFMNRLLREKLGWTRGNPTHEIKFDRNMDFSSRMHGYNKAIVLCQNENTGRALWEIGYMLENMLLQAKSLGISYESTIFSEDEILQLNKMGVTNPVAAFFI